MTLTAEDLKRFCGDYGWIENPWSAGDFTYATDRYLVIRVPRLPGVEESTEPDKAAKAEAYIQSIDGLPFYPLAGVECPPAEPCPACKGTGKIIECPECKGAGEVELDNDYNSYTKTCKTCNGSGEVDEECEECKATGKVPSKALTPIGGALFSAHILSLLLTLPGCEIQTPAFPAACYFRFDGGDGVAMPCREPGK